MMLERMSIGGLIFEGINSELWVILACVTDDYALKQHALIRGLQLDLSLAVSWACLGKLYIKLGENQLASQAFDRARSLDLLLALPWAGMSVAFHERNSLSEAYESCLRAVQIMPAGNMLEAEQECETLNKDGMLDCKGLQIYAVSSWKLGKNEQALDLARKLAKNVSTMDMNSSTAAIGLICQLIYHISGLDSVVSTILKLPRDYLHGGKMSLVISAVNALDLNNRLHMFLPHNLISFEAYDVAVNMHRITAMNKMILDGSEQTLDIQWC